jgi:hypothetical protein
MMFIGKCLNHARVKGALESGAQGRNHLSSQLQELSRLTYPLAASSFSRTILAIRQILSRNTLQKLLPLARIVEILQLFQDFFLLGRGEFAMALTQQADETIKNRWRRAENLSHEKRDALGAVVVKDGEVTAVLGRTWAVMGALQGQHADEDEGLELARDLVRLTITKSKHSTPLKLGSITLSTTPFRNLLFSIPVILTLQIPSPLDMFLTPSDLQVYSAINSFLLSIRRAHIRVTDLWKVTTLRRHHPAPPGPPLGSTRGGRSKVILLRERSTVRSSAMRSVWVTCSAAAFFLAETGAYLQTEVVGGLWDGFHSWIGADISTRGDNGKVPAEPQETEAAKGGQSRKDPEDGDVVDDDGDDDDDIWLSTAEPKQGATTSTSSQAKPGGKSDSSTPEHDPQTLASAHQLYLRALTRRLLLTQPTVTEPLYQLLVHIDHLVAHVHRLHGIWTSMDLEEDAGVVDAFVDLEIEEADVKVGVRDLESKVKHGIEEVISALRVLEMDSAFMADVENDGAVQEDGGVIDAASVLQLRDEGEYVPRRVGGIDRLLMKLDFGTWFGSRRRGTYLDG